MPHQPLNPYTQNYQLGFRVAKLAKLDGITCYDEQTVHWQGDKIMGYLSAQSPELNAWLGNTVAKLEAVSTKQQQTDQLLHVLAFFNRPDIERMNRALYLGLNPAGHGQDDTLFVGADTNASWWHRNFRMYAHIQRAAKEKGNVLVIGGGSHTALFRQMAKDDPWLEAAEVADLFRL